MKKSNFPARRKALFYPPLIHRDLVSKTEISVTVTETHNLLEIQISVLIIYACAHIHTHIYAQEKFCDHKWLTEIQTHSEARKLEIVSSLAYLPRPKFKALFLLQGLMASLTPKSV